MSNLINELLDKLTIKSKKDLEDAQEVKHPHVPDLKILQCTICKAYYARDTLKIDHYYGCKYFTSNPFNSGITLGHRIKSSKEITQDLSEGILQREYTIISSNSIKSIIGSYGAGPCIILCMRNRNNTKTILAHIDSITLNPLREFSVFDPKYTDVYIIGGDISSRDLIIRLLKVLIANGYNIIFAHVIMSESNQFAINCITGETWLDDELDPKSLPTTIDNKERNMRLTIVGYKESNLFKVNIPDIYIIHYYLIMKIKLIICLLE